MPCGFVSPGRGVLPHGPHDAPPSSSPEVAPWPFPPPGSYSTSPFPTWRCPEGTCECHPPEESAATVAHTIVFYDSGGTRMPGARCMIYDGGRAITSPLAAADAAGELVLAIAPSTTTLWVEWCPATLPTGPGMPFRKLYQVAVEANPVMSRLANLGFASDARVRENVSTYQRSQGLAVTGRAADIAMDVRKRHDGGALIPFSREPRLGGAPSVVRRPGRASVTADAKLASFLAAPPPLAIEVLDTLGSASTPAPRPQSDGTGGRQGAVVPNVGQLLVLVGLEPDFRALKLASITLRLLPIGGSNIAAGDGVELIAPTASGLPWGELTTSCVLFAFVGVPAGTYAVTAHVDGIDDAHRGYALGRTEIDVTVGLLSLAYVPVTRERPILTVDDPLLELPVDAMQRRRKVLATVFVEFPQSADTATAPDDMPPYQQGRYKAMARGLDATNTCAPVNVATMNKAGAPGHEFGFGQVAEIKNAQGVTTGLKPRPAFVKHAPGLAPSVGDSFLATGDDGQLHHCGIVVRSSPDFGELWLTADGGQPDRTAPFQDQGGIWKRFYSPPPNREAAYVLPRVFMLTDGRPRLGNRFVFPGETMPAGDVLLGWTDITHRAVRFDADWKANITQSDFRAMQRLVPAIERRARYDIDQATAEQRAHTARAVP